MCFNILFDVLSEKKKEGNIVSVLLIWFQI